MVVKCVIGVARLCDGRLSQRGKEVMVKLSESISRKKVPKFKLFNYNINHRVLKIFPHYGYVSIVVFVKI